MSRVYDVQFIIVHQVSVKSDNDIQAQKDAFKHLDSISRENAVAIKVIEQGDGPGALSFDTMTAWHFAKDKFETVDHDFLRSD